MNATIELGRFHDGCLDGLLVDGDTADFFLTSWDKKSFVLRLDGVEALNVEGFKKGNIILDVVVRARPDITYSDLIELCGYRDERDASARLERLGEDALIIEINPSYGASCLALARGAMLEERAG